MENISVKQIDVAGDTHIGLVRGNNEDGFVYRVSDSEPNSMVAVADGIGGHEGGDIASGLCLRTVTTMWRDSNLPATTSKQRLRRFLPNAIGKANRLIFNINKSCGIQHPMGTTVVAGVFSPTEITISHAGDSRCYRLRNGVLNSLTRDHSYVSDLVKKKLISAEEARNHPFSHIISRSVGPVRNLDLETRTFILKPRDRYLLCTDGLTNHVNDFEIETILYDAPDPQSAVRNLLYAALRGGGEDNITVLCVFL